MRRYIKFLALLTAVFLFSTSISYASENIWAKIERAAKLEESGSLDEASKVWVDIYKHFNNGKTNDELTNAALFSKKLGKYYDDIKNYDKAIFYYEEEDRLWTLVGKDWGKADLIRADQIRTVIEFFVKEEGPTHKNLAKYEPENGIYLGIYTENDKKIGQALEKTKEVYGEHEMYLFYEDWGYIHSQWTPEDGSYESAFNHIIAKKVRDVNGSLQVALNAMQGLEQVKEDKWIIDWAKAAAKYDIPIFLRFLCEMNGNWVPWNGNPALYREKFKLVHNIMEKYAPNVVMVWCPNDGPLELNGISADEYYPGDKYVDWVGVNFYVDYYDSGNVEDGNNHYQNPLDHLKYFYEKYSDRKPLMIGETGVTHFSLPNSEDLTDWGAANLEKLYGTLALKYPRVKAISYFSLNQNNENYTVGNRWNNYALSENKAIEAVYKRVIKDEYFLSDIGKGVSYHFKSVTEKELKAYNEVFLNAKLVDYKVSKVAFYADRIKISEDKTYPFSFIKDLSEVNTLRLDLFDSNGKLALTKEIELNPKESVQETAANVPTENTASPSAVDFTVEIPAFDITLNGYKVNQRNSSYPLISYNQITYVPLTWEMGQLMGLTTSWSQEKGLEISAGQQPKSLKLSEDGSNNIGGSDKAQKAAGGIIVNGKPLNNSNEPYPILLYKDITYFPLTWRFVVDEFGWKLSFDTIKGLIIQLDNNK